MQAGCCRLRCGKAFTAVPTSITETAPCACLPWLAYNCACRCLWSAHLRAVCVSWQLMLTVMWCGEAMMLAGWPCSGEALKQGSRCGLPMLVTCVHNFIPSYILGCRRNGMLLACMLHCCGCMVVCWQTIALCSWWQEITMLPVLQWPFASTAGAVKAAYTPGWSVPPQSSPARLAASRAAAHQHWM
jgi:hypothetical protein